MTQAIGRVCRHGQKKTIHVYHFLGLKTADVDVFEGRRKAILVKDGDRPDGFDVNNIDYHEWDDPTPALQPKIQDWQPSGFRMVEHEDFPAGAPSGGEYSSTIHEAVIRCMDSTLEDEDELDDEEDADDYFDEDYE